MPHPRSGLSFHLSQRRCLIIVRTVHIPYEAGDVFTLLPIGDIHLGNKTCDVTKLKRNLESVTDKTLIVGLGDWLDSIIIKDEKRYRKSLDDSETESVIDEQINRCAEIFAPYSKNILGLGDGNHEENIISRCGTNPVKRLSEKLSTPEHTIIYLGYSWLLQLALRQKDGAGRKVIIRGHHGWGNASRTEGADITKYSHDTKFWAADIFLYGHTHKLKSNDVEEGRVTGEESWQTFQKKMVVCGTYQRTYTNNTTATYAERMGLPPVSVRNPIIFIKPIRLGTEITVQH